MIQYIVGDATRPINTDKPNHVIAHVCNDIGGWGAGFVVALSRMDKKPERKYREWFHSDMVMKLGMVQIVKVRNGLYVSNMIGQHDTKGKLINEKYVPPVRYEAIETCLDKTASWAKEHNADIHMPRIGCGLAGGKWEEIEAILHRTIQKYEVNIYVYDLPGK